MLNVKANTFTVIYSEIEDRMQLIINKEIENGAIVLCITRRFYISLLFELETFLEEKKISYNIQVINKKKNNKPKTTKNITLKLQTVKKLLENFSIVFNTEKEQCKVTFQAKDIYTEAILEKRQISDFYLMLKRAFPIKEWGII